MKSLFFIIIIFFIYLAGCKNTINSPVDIVFPEKDVSYSRHVEPFLNLTCSFSGCHGNRAAGGIRLNDYFSIINSPGLVIPYNPDGSLLNQILDGRKTHFTYFERTLITENHVQGMRQWVLEGAKLTNK